MQVLCQMACPQPQGVSVANWFYDGGSQKSPPTENQLLKKKKDPKNLFKSEKKRNFAA